MQDTEEKGFLSSEEIAKEITGGYERRTRDRDRKGKKFVPSSVFFDSLIKNWVDESMIVDQSDTRTLSRSHKVAGFMDCNNLTDEWWKCFLTNPFDSSPLYASPHLGFTSPFLFKKHASNVKSAKVYMIGLSGFRTPDVRRIVMTERVPILIPIYNVSVAAEEHLWDSG